VHLPYGAASSEHAKFAGVTDEAKLKDAELDPVAGGGLAVIVVSGAGLGAAAASGTASTPTRTTGANLISVCRRR
jgi:hypothetical protein